MNRAHQESPRVQLAVRAVPRASRNEITGFCGAELKVRLQAPPVDGKANACLQRLLADTLGIPRGNVEIVRGDTSRHKQVVIRGLTEPEVRRRLSA